MKQAKQWAKMLASPSTTLVRAPSSTPYLASTARFVKSIDVPYSATNGGKFTIVAGPDPKHAYTTVYEDNAFPTLPGELSAVSHKASNGVGVSGAHGTYSSQTFLGVHFEAANTRVVGHLQDRGKLAFGVADGVLIYSFEAPALATLDLSYLNKANLSLIFKVYNADGTETVLVSNNASVARNNFVLAKDMIGFLVLASGDGTGEISYNITCATAQTVTVPGTQRVNPLVRSELIEQGKVETCRCTGMEMLITNMAPPVNAGGELVVARMPRKSLNQAGPVMDNIKQQPEQLYWRSGSVADGGWAFWLPDDLASYEPHSVGYAGGTDNVLVASGNLTADGLVRVMITWTYEFYTPAQAFSRDYNFAHDQYTQMVWDRIVRQPAVAANFGHEALIALVISAVLEKLTEAVPRLIRQWTAKPVVQDISKTVAIKSGATGGELARMPRFIGPQNRPQGRSNPPPPGGGPKPQGQRRRRGGTGVQPGTRPLR